MVGTEGARNGVGRTDEVAILEVEAVQLIASLLGIHDIFVYDESSALGGVGDALTDLAGWVSVTVQPAMSAQRFASALRSKRLLNDCLGSIDVPDGTELSKEVEELLGRYVVAATVCQRLHIPAQEVFRMVYLKFLTNRALLQMITLAKVQRLGGEAQGASRNMRLTD